MKIKNILKNLKNFQNYYQIKIKLKIINLYIYIYIFIKYIRNIYFIFIIYNEFKK